MISYYGDFAEDDTVLIPFNTFSSDDPSASVTITDLVDADLKVHKDGGTTQIATDGATIAIDYDSITGNHLVTIDTSAHADYSTGSEYAVRMEGTTVDGATINAWIGAFSIERAGGALALLKGANGVAAIKTDTAAILVDTGTTLDGKIDTIDTNVDAILVDTGTTLPATLATIDGIVDAILVDTNELQSDDVPGLIAALNDISSANVLTQVNAALDTAIAELGVAAPTATPTLRTGLMLLYMTLRNKTSVQTSGTDALEVNNNAGTIIAKKLLTDDGSDYVEAEMTSG